MSDRPIRRVLIAWDASPAALEAVQAAVELAARHAAALTGLWVEESEPEGWWRAAPGAGGVVLPAGSVAAIRAARGREAIERAAAIHRLAWSFRVERGEATRRILEAAAEHDVVALGRSGWSRHPSHRLGKTAAALVASSRGVLIPYDRDRARVLLLLFGAGE